MLCACNTTHAPDQWRRRLPHLPLLPTARPSLCSLVLLTAARTAVAVVPSQRSTSVGMGLLLHHAPAAGSLAAIKDYLRVALGTRVLLGVLLATALHQPPLAVSDGGAFAVSGAHAGAVAAPATPLLPL